MIKYELVTPKELNDAIMSLRQFDRIADKELRRFLTLSGQAMEAAVRPLTPVFQTRLRNSIVSKVTGSFPNSLQAKVGSTIAKKEVYPAVMEFGRKPGAKMPPPSALERWVHLVLKVPTERARGVAFVVARAIGRRGIKGKKFMQKGFEQSKPKMLIYFEQALNRIVEAIIRGG